MIDTEEIKNRYKQQEIAVDVLGRTFHVGRLKLSQQTRINEFSESAINRTLFLMVASLRKYQKSDGVDLHLPFPKSREEVESVLDMLGDEGFDALTEAYRKLHGMPDLNAKPGVEGDGAPGS